MRYWVIIFIHGSMPVVATAGDTQFEADSFVQAIWKYGVSDFGIEIHPDLRSPITKAHLPDSVCVVKSSLAELPYPFLYAKSGHVVPVLDYSSAMEAITE